MIGGVVLVVVTVIVTAADASAFMNLPGLLIVLGGTLAATFVSYPLREVLTLFRVFGIVLRNERLYAEEDIRELVHVSRLWFQYDLEAVERHLGRIRNPFLRTGIQAVVDQTPLDKVVDLLRWRIARMHAQERAEAQIFRTMAHFAPAFGMLGTLVGLINMLGTLGTAGVAQIGTNMGIALVTTFYGLILANLVFKPFALKLERRTEQRVMLMNMVLEGVTFLSERRSPSFIRETLNSFMAHHEDEIRQGSIEVPEEPRRRSA
jgi:chemotaxis protein MotA